MTKEIPLTQGFIAIVDDEDYPEISKYKWNSQIKKHTVYAVRHDYKNGKRITMGMHNFITQFKEVDHINRNGLDNRRENLRESNKRINAMNKIKHRGSSIYKGVSWSKKLKKWKAGIRVEGKNIHLGYFTNEENAARKYNKAANKYFGDCALLNKIKYPPGF